MTAATYPRAHGHALDAGDRYTLIAIAACEAFIATVLYFGDPAGTVAPHLAAAFAGLFAAASASTSLWVLLPRSRYLYAASGSLAGGAFFSRGAIALATVVRDPSTPSSVAVAALAYFTLTLLVGLSWRHLRPSSL